MRSPLIVIGSHRSGTTALVRVLAELGVFVGARREPNEEATFFLRLNEWLLRSCGGRWDRPLSIDDLLAEPVLRQRAVDHLRLVVRSPRVISYLGIADYLFGTGLMHAAQPWAFKDPRTTFTLPLWREVFPQARVVHVHRHGVDVAASLWRRQQLATAQSADRDRRNRPWFLFAPKRAGFTDSPRCATPDGAFELWEEYVTRGRQHIAAIGGSSFDLPFEELVESPAGTVEALCAWAELDVPAGARARAAALLDPMRARAFERDPDWRAFAERVAHRVTVARGTAIPSSQPALT